MMPRATRRARPVQRIHDAGTRIAATAWRRWFLDRHTEFWLRELGTRWSLVERRARVVDLIDETPDTRTLVLAPGRGWPGHRAGQYVPIELEVDGVRMRRCYSISSGGSAPGARRIAITVRRVVGGKVSTALHQLRRGALVTLGVPAGEFVLEPGSPASAKLLLVAGGSGVTPIVAMLRDLAAGDAAPDVVVIHGSRGADDAIFADELASLATRLPWLRVLSRRDDQAGRLDRAALAGLVPDLADREIYVCGPAGLMDVVTAAAGDANAGHRVHHERFVAAPIAGAAKAAAEAMIEATAEATIELRRAGTQVVARGPGSLLAQLERAGQQPAYGCRMGICNTCRCRKRTGTVEDLLTGAVSSEPDQDIRLCVSIARSDLALDL
ncbi:MAG: ferredoxin reductase [Kofleriaceae bacterium]